MLKREIKMGSNNSFYKESGNISALGLALSFLICSLLSLFLGYVYTAITILIPIIYFNFLITLGFGGILGIACKLIIRISHNRNRTSQFVQAIIIGILANYFQWITYIVYAYNGEFPALTKYLSYLSLLNDQGSLFQAIIEINRIGMWSIFGLTFNGFALTIVWIFEALIIMAVPVISIYYFKSYPYSETLSKWYPKYTLFKDFESVAAVNMLLNGLQENPLKTIHEMGNGSGVRHTKIHLFYLKDENKQYLSFEKIYIEGQGKGKVNSTIVINNLAIDTQMANRILAEFEHKRERIEVI